MAWSDNGETGSEETIFDGLPLTLGDLVDYANAVDLAAELNGAQKHIDLAISSWPDGRAVANHALAALRAIDCAAKECPENSKSEVIHRLEKKRRQLVRVLAKAQGINCQFSLSEYDVLAGGSFSAKLQIDAQGQEISARLHLPSGWTATPWDKGKCQVKIASDTSPSNPYPDTWFPDCANEPFHLVLDWEMGGIPISLQVEPQERLQVLPPIQGRLSPANAIFNLRNPDPVTTIVTDPMPFNAKSTLDGKSGWKIGEKSDGFEVSGDNSIPPGLYGFPLKLNGEPAFQLKQMEYDHTGKTTLCQPAALRVRVLDVELPKVRIAYVGGGSDKTDHWLRRARLAVKSFDGTDFANATLGDFDTILIGIFAFRSNPILNKRLAELHQWVRNGGNLVTLYHRPWDNWDADNTALSRLKIGSPSIRWRVTDETAHVTHLIPDHPILNTPNQIGPDDWQDWSKERGLYFSSEWDSRYVPLLSMADRGENALQGALLSGQFGKGRHSHTSLILHYQVEQLVPGAFRILANLLSNPLCQ